MRKIEQKMIAAVRNLEPFNSGNTTVSVTSDPRDNKGHETNVYLHGNHIARFWYSKVTDTARDMRVTLAGWNTATTRSRLSALIRAFNRAESYPHGLGISSRKGDPAVHDARGRTPIDVIGWHAVQLEG